MPRRPPSPTRSPASSGRASRSRQQKGVVGIMAAFALVLALAAAALSVDMGRLWLEKRAVQRTADMAALAAGRFIGCGTSNADGQAAVQDALNRNGGGTTATLEYGTLALNADKTRQFTAGGNSQSADAVQVTVTKSVRKSLIDGAYGKDMVNVVATSVASGNAPAATFAINSVYGLNTSNTQLQSDAASLAKATSGLFGAILGTNKLTLSVTDLAALQAQTVTLASLTKAAGAASPENMLDKTYTVHDMLMLFGQANNAIAGNQAYKDILTASIGKTNVFFTLGDVLYVHRPISKAMQSVPINILDLVLTGVQVGGYRGGGLFSFGLNSNMFMFTVAMGNAPKMALGPAGKGSDGQWCTGAASSQVSIRVGFNLPFLANMAMRVDSSAIEGHLEKLRLNPGDIQGQVATQNTGVIFIVTNMQDVAKGPVTDPSNYGNAKFLPFNILQLGLYQPLLADPYNLTSFTGQSKADFPQPIQLGAGSLGKSIAGLLGNKANLNISILGLGVNINFIDDLVSLVLTPVGQILDGMLALFGVKTGSVYVQMRSVQALQPQLVQ